MIVIDAETVPRSEAELEEFMPEKLKNAKMPEDIASPIKPDWEKDCPAYGGNAEKRATWIAIKKEKWLDDTEKAKEKWMLKQAEARQAFFDDAALDARYSEVKLIGWRDTAAKETLVFVCGATDQQQKEINEATYSCKVTLFFGTEADMLTEVFKCMRSEVIGNKQIPGDEEAAQRNKLVGYATHIFDLVFFRRRAFLLHVAKHFPRALIKGRYFNSLYSIDLMEEWQMSERDARTGGLDGLCHLLGVKRKTDSGRNFWIKFRDSAAAGVQYLIDDLDCTEEAANIMGVS